MPGIFLQIERAVERNLAGCAVRCRATGQQFGNHPIASPAPLTDWKTVPAESWNSKGTRIGEYDLMRTSGTAVMENVRRYRTIASLYRQTASFRPLLRRSLLEQAEAWEQRAVAELEAYFSASNRFADREPRFAAATGRELRAAA